MPVAAAPPRPGPIPSVEPEHPRAGREHDGPPREDAATLPHESHAGRAHRVIDAGGRLVELDLDASDRRTAIACHLLPLTALVLFPIGLAAPLIPWLIGRDRSAYVDDHGRAALDAAMSYGLWLLVSALTVVGFVLWPILIVVGVVSSIRASIDASNGRYVRYPLALSILT